MDWLSLLLNMVGFMDWLSLFLYTVEHHTALTQSKFIFVHSGTSHCTNPVYYWIQRTGFFVDWHFFFFFFKPPFFFLKKKKKKKLSRVTSEQRKTHVLWTDSVYLSNTMERLFRLVSVDDSVPLVFIELTGNIIPLSPFLQSSKPCALFVTCFNLLRCLRRDPVRARLSRLPPLPSPGIKCRLLWGVHVHFQQERI